MKEGVDTKHKRMNELKQLRQRVAQLEALEVERKQAEEALQRSKEFIETVMNSITDSISIIDTRDFRVIGANNTFRKSLKMDGKEVMGKTCYELTHRLSEPCGPPDHICPTFETVKTGRPSLVEHVHWDKDGNRIYVEISAHPVTNEKGEVCQVVHVARDITERKRAEEALQKAYGELERRVEERTAELAKANDELRREIEERKRAEEALRLNQARLELLHSISSKLILGMSVEQVIQHTVEQLHEYFPDLRAAYSTIDPQGKLTVLYAAEPKEMPELTGLGADLNHAPDYLSALLKRDLVIVEDVLQDTRMRPLADAMSAGNTRAVLDMPLVHSERLAGLLCLDSPKPRVWGEHEAAALKEIAAYLTIALESTHTQEKRDQAEKALRQSEMELRLLSSQLLTAQEKERKRIAGELHDSIGQTLTALKFNVENALSQMNGPAVQPIDEPLRDLISMIQGAIEEVRRIQSNLRPPILDDLGILATIAWFCRESQKIYSNIRIERQINIQENEVPDLLKTVIYRLLQEAMNNIAKHSKADLVNVYLEKTDGSIELVIEDNGQGFDIKTVRSGENVGRGLGLASMKERTELSGGAFSIESSGGKGTVVRASWPMTSIA